MTMTFDPHADWRREDRERKPLDPSTRARITGASDEALVAMLNDAETCDHPELVDALIGEAVSRWYAPAGRAS